MAHSPTVDHTMIDSDPDQRISTVENPIPCPVPSPDGLPCTKTINPGWTVAEGHSGGHFWADEKTQAILNGGHYNATAAVSGQPFAGHRHEDCPGEPCPAQHIAGRNVSVVSFGFGHSPAPVAGIIRDVRDSLRNPHHDPAMRELTGLDQRVYEHVMATPGARELVDATAVRVLAGETDSVAVGCVGGRHRSVALAIAIGAQMAAAGLQVIVEHRDVDKPVLVSGRHGPASAGSDPLGPGTPYPHVRVDGEMLRPPAEARGLSALRVVSGEPRQYSAVEYDRWEGVEHFIRTLRAIGYVRASSAEVGRGYAVLDVLDANGDIIFDYEIPTAAAFFFVKRKLRLSVVDVEAEVAADAEARRV